MAQIGWPANANGTFRSILIKKNGTSWIAREQIRPPTTTSGSAACLQNISCVDYASDIDYYEVFALQDSGNTLTLLASDSGMTLGSAVKIA